MYSILDNFGNVGRIFIDIYRSDYTLLKNKKASAVIFTIASVMNKQIALVTEKKRRNRSEPTKKWTDKETRKILDYILENMPLEKPSARVYYEKLNAGININVRWSLIKQKVRYLKNVYIKASNYLEKVKTINTSMVGPHISEEEAKDYIKKICPHFVRLKRIYGSMCCTFDTNNDDSINNVFKLEEENEALEKMEEDHLHAVICGQLALDPSMVVGANEVCETYTWINEMKQKQVPSSKLELEWERLQFERYKFEKEFELKKLQLCRANDGEQEQLALRERLVKYELTLKYSNNAN